MKNEPVYCRYHQISPFCVAKERPLRKAEMTLEHLIPKTKMRESGFRDKYGLKGIGTSSPENTDITCHQCNHYKKNATDLEFVWKLRYFEQNRIDIKNKSRLFRSLRFAGDPAQFNHEDAKRLLHTLQYGEFSLNGAIAELSLGRNRVFMDAGKLTLFKRGEKVIFI